MLSLQLPIAQGVGLKKTVQCLNDIVGCRQLVCMVFHTIRLVWVWKTFFVRFVGFVGA
jgi:hypothetical protein